MEEREFLCFRLCLAALLSRCTFLTLSPCLLLLLAPVRCAQSDTDADPLPMLVHVLRGTADPELQLDILRGMSAAFKGRRQVPMPKGWETVEAQLEGSPNADVRALAQSLSLTFGSTAALVTLRQTASDRSADLNARRTALNSLLDIKDAGLPPLLQQLLNDADLRGAAARGLAAYDDPKTPAAILAAYDSLDGPEKRDALNTLASRGAFAAPMLAAMAQGTITGQVKDKTGSPVSGATIAIKNKKTSTFTGTDGRFSIIASAGDVLVVSSIGYDNSEVTVGSGSSVNVELTTRVSSLDDVIVVGYGTQKKKDLTGSIVNINIGDTK